VAALDGIRTALSMGAWSDAEQQLARYRKTFAEGALRTEAEVLAIETLRAQGREEAAAGAAERFIAQHPRDPQVARVRALTE
jgi:outer membrane protein assembly factor BamD (BamD/ComL family)